MKENLSDLINNGEVEKFNARIKSAVQAEEARGNFVACHLSITATQDEASDTAIRCFFSAQGNERALEQAFTRLFVKKPRLAIVIGGALAMAEPEINENDKAVFEKVKQLESQS